MALRALVVGGLLVAGAGLAVELVHARSHADMVERAVAMFSLSYEQNLPTWYSTCLLFTCALALANIARSATRMRAHWWILAAGFTYMSLDEASEIHEHLGGMWGGSGLLYFDWVIPASVAVAVLAIVYLPFLRQLPTRARRRFVIAAAVYLSGAVAMELPLGWWTESAGTDNLTYALIDWVEESLEIAGASLFLYSLINYRPAAEEARA